MTEKSNAKTWQLCIILLVAGFILFLQLGSLPLLDPDEPVYAQTPREMILFNDFISPRIYMDYWYDKPPMYYWLVAGAFKVFGFSEFAARVPSALLAISGVLFVYYFGRKIFNDRAGFFAGLVLVTSIEYFYLGKAAVTDMTLTFFITAALLLFWQRKYTPAWASTALAVLTKGPIGIVFPVMIVLGHAFWTRSWERLQTMNWFRGILVFSVLAFPWYGIMYHFHGMEFINTFLGFHNITRFLEPEHADGKLWYYYVPVLTVGFFPWTAFLAQTIRAALRNVNERDGSVLVFLVSWAAIVFGFFTVSQTKLVSYILPMFPPLALLTGWYIDRILAEKNLKAFTIAYAVFAFLAALLAAAFYAVGTKWDTGSAVAGATGMAIVLALMIGFGFAALRRETPAGLFGSFVIGMIFFVTVLMTGIFPAVAPAFSMKEFAAVFKAHYDGQAVVYVEKFFRPGFMFYTGLPGEVYNKNAMSPDGGMGQRKAYFIIKEKNYRKLPPDMQQKLQLLAEGNGKVLLIKYAE